MVLYQNQLTILPAWIDYNGHMNVAYYILAFDNATAFRHNLMLDHHAGKSGLMVPVNGPLDIRDVTEACVTITDDRDGNRSTDTAALVRQFTVGYQPSIRETQPGNVLGTFIILLLTSLTLSVSRLMYPLNHTPIY